MKFKFINIVVQTSMLFSIACFPSDDKHEFIKSKAVVTDSLYIDLVQFGDAKAINDSLFLLIDRKSNVLFHLYNIKNFEKMLSFGHRGEGPEEFRMPKFNGQVEFENDSLAIYITDISLSKIAKIRLKNDFSSTNTSYQKVADINEELILAIRDNYVLSNRKVIIGSCFSSKGTFFKWDLENNMITYFGKIVNIDQPLSELQIHYLNENDLNISKDGETILTSKALFKEVIFYDFDFTLLKEYKIEDDYKADIRFDDEFIFAEGVKNYFRRSYVSDKDYYFTLSSEKIEGEIKEPKSKIYTFNKLLELEEEIELDRWVWSPFSVNPENREITIISADKMSDELYFVKYSY